MTSRDERVERIADRLMAQTIIVQPGEELFVILHTGEEGLVPPQPGDPVEAVTDGFVIGGGKGHGHCFGPFTSPEEASAWEQAFDAVGSGPCGCRRTLLRLVVPRILATLGPATVPVEIGDDGRKDRLN